MVALLASGMRRNRVLAFIVAGIALIIALFVVSALLPGDAIVIVLLLALCAGFGFVAWRTGRSE